MAFLIFSKEKLNDQIIYRNLNEHYQLAGWGLIYGLWEKIGKPLDKGYSFSANDILNHHNESYTSDNFALMIDFHPKSTYRIGLIEIENIHLYTYGDSGIAIFTPMMLEIKDAFYKEDYENLTQEQKTKIIAEFTTDQNKQSIIEFLYLNGDDKSWNWGRNGMTNAAFIHEQSRKYFRNFF